MVKKANASVILVAMLAGSPAIAATAFGGAAFNVIAAVDLAALTFTNGNEASLQAIANDVAPMATVWEDDLYTLASKGLVQKTVRSSLLNTGEVGDGDGVFISAKTPSFEAAALFANFLMSDAVQVAKMEKTGSRTARQDLSFAGKIPAELGACLVPDAMYVANTRPRINGLISDAAADLFVKAVIAQ